MKYTARYPIEEATLPKLRDLTHELAFNKLVSDTFTRFGTTKVRAKVRTYTEEWEREPDMVQRLYAKAVFAIEVIP
jgi:hypothetical protein